MTAPPDGSRGTRTALAALVGRYELPPEAAERLAVLAARVAGDEHAPTTVREPGAIVRDHLADSLVALELAELRAARRLADIGSGAGFPALPLAVALPGCGCAAIESSLRKCEFISRTAAAARLENVEVLPKRVEELVDLRDRFDVVTARALAPLEVVVEWAAPLVAHGGVLIAWKGRRVEAEEAAGAAAAAQVGLALEAVLHVEPYRAATDRHLHVYRKVAETPGRFPRRPGVARKRPLGAGRGTSHSTDGAAGSPSSAGLGGPHAPNVSAETSAPRW